MIERTVLRVGRLFLKDRASLFRSTGGKDGDPRTIVIRQPTNM
jgi:hypothetical protein